MPSLVDSAHPLILEALFVDAALHYQQPPLFNNNAHNPLPLILDRFARNPTFPVNKASSFTYQLAPALALLTSGFPFPAVTSPTVTQLHNRRNWLPIAPHYFSPHWRQISVVMSRCTSAIRASQQLRQSHRHVSATSACAQRRVSGSSFAQTPARVVVEEWRANVASKSSTGTCTRLRTIPSGPVVNVRALVGHVLLGSPKISRTRSVIRDGRLEHRTREVEKLELQ